MSSLCSLCSSAPRSAQTCFCLPPLNSLLSERGQRPGTVTYPGGGWRTLPPDSPPWEMGCVSPSLYFVYTWVPYCPSDQLTECRESCCIQFPALFCIVPTDQYVLRGQLYGVIVLRRGKTLSTSLKVLITQLDVLYNQFQNPVDIVAPEWLFFVVIIFKICFSRSNLFSTSGKKWHVEDWHFQREASLSLPCSGMSYFRWNQVSKVK